MPQNPLQYTVALGSTGSPKPLTLNTAGDLRVDTSSQKSSLNLASGVVVVKATPGKVGVLNVTTAGSTAGKISDCITSGAVAAGNLIFSIPNTVGVYRLDFPALVGITVTVGTGQVCSLSFE
jgi:hypothetical protein